MAAGSDGAASGGGVVISWGIMGGELGDGFLSFSLLLACSLCVVKLSFSGCRLMTTLILPFRGRKRGGILSHVLRPMITALSDGGGCKVLG